VMLFAPEGIQQANLRALLRPLGIGRGEEGA